MYMYVIFFLLHIYIANRCPCNDPTVLGVERSPERAKVTRKIKQWTQLREQNHAFFRNFGVEVCWLKPHCPHPLAHLPPVKSKIELTKNQWIHSDSKLKKAPLRWQFQSPAETRHVEIPTRLPCPWFPCGCDGSR